MTKTINTALPDTATVPGTLKLPHERDESVSMTDSAITAVGKQAFRDLKRGLKDTSRGTAANRAYEKLKKDAA